MLEFNFYLVEIIYILCTLQSMIENGIPMDDVCVYTTYLMLFLLFDFFALWLLLWCTFFNTNMP